MATILAGYSHIDHANALRAGATRAVLPFRVMAPSTLGTFLRAFTFGHVRQLDAVIAETVRRAWAPGAGPGDDETMVIDMDSTICEVHGKKKHGAAYGYTKKLGYHPLVATLAATGEVLHARLRKGSSQRGHKRFVEELIARVRRAGAPGALCVRADGGFWSHDLIDTLRRLGVGFSITVRINKTIRAAIEAIAEDAWVPIVYPESGEAAVAETTYTTGRGRRQRGYRLVVRRSRLTDPAQQALWPDWRYHAFVTSSTTDAVTADRFHRDHARGELAIRDLKDGAGLEHCPSGQFFANAAWLACAVLTHNLLRWTDQLGGTRHGDQLTVARTVRTRLLALPGRLVKSKPSAAWRRSAVLVLSGCNHSPSLHQTQGGSRSHQVGALTTCRVRFMLRTGQSFHPASSTASQPNPGASLPGTMASPRTGLSPAGYQQLVVRLRHVRSFAVMASELLDARGSRLRRPAP